MNELNNELNNEQSLQRNDKIFVETKINYKTGEEVNKKTKQPKRARLMLSNIYYWIKFDKINTLSKTPVLQLWIQFCWTIPTNN